MAIARKEEAQRPEVLLPRTPEEAWRLKRGLGDAACYVAGGTLLRAQWENEVRPMPPHLISLERIAELRGIRQEPGAAIAIGALTPLCDCRSDPALMRGAALLPQAIAAIAAPAVRNLATIGGNVASLVGDAVPALLALDAELEICRGERERVRIPLRAWLAGAGGVRERDDLVCVVRVPAAPEAAEAVEASAESAAGGFGFYEKLGRREAFSPSLVTVAAAGRMDDDGVLSGVRLSAGGGAAVPHRLDDAEAALNGSRLSDSTLSVVHKLIERQYAAAGDLFAGAPYRKEATANLITAQLWKLMKR